MNEADKSYALEYQHDGQVWALNFYAVDEDDAQAKLHSLRASVVLLGRTVFTVPFDSTADVGD
jgi:regulator of PEP synthase PpsR (kinase-PPPase family)